MAIRSYSRLAELEKKKNTRSALIFGGLTILSIVLVVFFGIKILSNVFGFFGNLNDDQTKIDSQDTTPPAPPKLNNVPDYTNTSELVIEGTAEAGTTIDIKQNAIDKEVVTNASGIFTTTLNLVKGENTIILKATDQAGNESSETAPEVVIFDDEKPTVEITKPKDGDSFFGTKQKQISVEGKTDTEASVTINGRVVVVDSEGKFSFPTNLGDGENSFNIKSTDQAGNQTEITIKVTYSP